MPVKCTVPEYQNPSENVWPFTQNSNFGKNSDPRTAHTSIELESGTLVVQGDLRLITIFSVLLGWLFMGSSHRSQQRRHNHTS